MPQGSRDSWAEMLKNAKNMKKEHRLVCAHFKGFWKELDMLRHRKVSRSSEKWSVWSSYHHRIAQASFTPWPPFLYVTVFNHKANSLIFLGFGAGPSSPLLRVERSGPQSWNYAVSLPMMYLCCLYHWTNAGGILQETWKGKFSKPQKLNLWRGHFSHWLQWKIPPAQPGQWAWAYPLHHAALFQSSPHSRKVWGEFPYMIPRSPVTSEGYFNRKQNVFLPLWEELSFFPPLLTPCPLPIMLNNKGSWTE